MLSGTDSKNAIFPCMTKANYDELEFITMIDILEQKLELMVAIQIFFCS